jgi:photosystem II stability/assembly factor-like uncharacterized protein
VSDRFYVATRKGLFTIARGRADWRIVRAEFVGDAISMVLPDPRDGVLYAAFLHGHFGSKLHRSRDGGETWAEGATPEYPPKPEGVVDKDSAGTEIPWTLKQIWALAPGHIDQPGVLWCGTIPGGLFRSEDRGDSWQLNRPLWDHPLRKEWFGGGADLPGIHSVLVDPRDPRRVIVGVSCGGVWVTDDGGQTWACRAHGMRAEYMPPERAHDPHIQDPHCVAQCAARPDALWAQHHNGVFRTTDGCRSWQEIENVPPSVFGFATAVHPRDPDTAWFVPAIKDEKRVPVDGKVVVVRTRDGGKTFTVLRQGLPQEHAYDLTYRHALDIDATGDRLAFGSTTGAVWVSEDQGDTWQTVSTHLPPVYCVRFARAG